MAGRTAVPDYRRRMEADLKVAERVHRSMIPVNQQRANLEITCGFIPMIGVGGDYASVHFQDDQHVVVGICDVAGHGIASALLASRVNSFVLSHAPRVCHPCELVDLLNEFIFRTFLEAELYLTFFSLYIDLNKQTIEDGCEFAHVGSAGSPFPGWRCCQRWCVILHLLAAPERIGNPFPSERIQPNLAPRGCGTLPA